MAVSMVNTMDGLCICSSTTGVVGRRWRKHQLASRFHDVQLQITNLWVGPWPLGAPIADVVVVMVVVMVVMDQVVDGSDAPLATLVVALTVVSTTVGVDLFSPLVLPIVVEAQYPPFDFPENVADVFEELFVAASWLREAGDCAVIGEVAGSLLLHQLVLPLFGFRKLCCYHNQAQVNHEERTNLWEPKEDRPLEGQGDWPCSPHTHQRSVKDKWLHWYTMYSLAGVNLGQFFMAECVGLT